MGIESFSLIMDFLVSILLCAVVFYAIRLNRYFVLLNSQRQELASQLNTFADSTRRAEQVVAIIKATTAENATLIERQIRRAEAARQDIDRALDDNQRSGRVSKDYSSSPPQSDTNSDTPPPRRRNNNQTHVDDSLKIRPMRSARVSEGDPIQVNDEVQMEADGNNGALEAGNQGIANRARMREMRMQQLQNKNNRSSMQSEARNTARDLDEKGDTDDANQALNMPARGERPARSRSELLKALQGMR